MNYIYGDITSITHGIIAHGVNQQLKMNSGVARAIRYKWEKSYYQYIAKVPVPKLGYADEVFINDHLYIMNCYTQQYYGRDHKQYASLDAVIESLTYVALFSKRYNLNINIPKIGCGLGGLNWMIVKGKIIEIENEYDVKFNVYIL